MFELIIVESIIGIFLFLHIVRPYVKAFRESDGFAFFPLAALFCSIAMIPAYGIRLECFPLFLFSLVYSVWHFPSVAAVFSSFKQYPVRNNSDFLSFIVAAMLAFSLGTAFRFLPPDEPAVDNTQKMQVTISDPARGIDLFVSYYQGKSSDLVLIIPPITIPLSMIEGMCAAFNETGYNVLAFSRPHFDCAAVAVTNEENGKTVELPVFEKTKRYIQAISGVRNTKMAKEQLSAVAEREADIRFLLSALRTDGLLREALSYKGNNENPYYENVFLLGYGAGGAASVRLAGNKNFLRMNPAVKAAAAIESVVLCDFSDQQREPGANWRQNVENVFKEMFQKPIPRLENIAHPEIPVLFIAGDGAQQKNSYRRYMAVVQTMIESEAPFLFASISGLHAVDFSSLPQKYPVLPFLLRANPQSENESVWPRKDAIAKTAGYIAAFFSHAKENPSLAYLQSNLAMPEVVSLETSRSQ
jgi:hypothetical protein